MHVYTVYLLIRLSTYILLAYITCLCRKHSASFLGTFSSVQNTIISYSYLILCNCMAELLIPIQLLVPIDELLLKIIGVFKYPE